MKGAKLPFASDAHLAPECDQCETTSGVRSIDVIADKKTLWTVQLCAVCACNLYSYVPERVAENLVGRWVTR